MAKDFTLHEKIKGIFTIFSFYWIEIFHFCSSLTFVGSCSFRTLLYLHFIVEFVYWYPAAKSWTRSKLYTEILHTFVREPYVLHPCCLIIAIPSVTRKYKDRHLHPCTLSAAQRCTSNEKCPLQKHIACLYLRRCLMPPLRGPFTISKDPLKKFVLS